MFKEDWFPPESCTAITELVGKTAGISGRVVEIGSWEGRSTCALATAVYPETVHAVDTWKGSPGEISADLAEERDVYSAFLANIAELTKGNVAPYRMGWRDYFATHEHQCRFLFIDAEHTYEEVRDTIARALPFMSPGGIICGDDAHHEPVQKAVLEAFSDANLAATLWWVQLPGGPLEPRYKRLCEEPSDIWLHLPRFVKLVEELDATHVIELGTRTGVSTVAWLYALEGRGTLTSVDLDSKPPIGEYGHWTYIQGDDLDPAVLSQLEPADIVFIDTSHLYEQTVAELNIYRHLVKPGGRIVCHDTQLAHPEGAPPRPSFPVRTAIEEFTAGEGYRWHEYEDSNGLGVIEVG